MEKETKQQQMWRAMRILKDFDITELRLAVSSGGGYLLKEWTAKSYCKILVRAGYLKMLDKERFKMVKFSGLLAPLLTREKRVIDPNTEELIEIYKERKPKYKEQILTVINKGEEFTIQDIYNKTGINKLVIRTIIKRLIKEETIKHIGKRKVQDNLVNIYI